jgi:hypothetical protein
MSSSPFRGVLLFQCVRGGRGGGGKAEVTALKTASHFCLHASFFTDRCFSGEVKLDSRQSPHLDQLPQQYMRCIFFKMFLPRSLEHVKMIFFVC